MTTQPRQPAGNPQGGEFATKPGGAESTLPLPRTPVTPPVWDSTEHTEHDNGRHLETTQHGHGDNDFNNRVRLLLGAPHNARVTVTHTETEYDIGGWGVTWETDTEVTITAAHHTRTFPTIADLIRRLEHVDPTGNTPAVTHYTDTDLLAYLQQTVTIVTPNGHTWTGRVGNAQGHTVLLIGTTPVPEGRSSTPYRPQDKPNEVWSWVNITHIENIQPTP